MATLDLRKLFRERCYAIAARFPLRQGPCLQTAPSTSPQNTRDCHSYGSSREIDLSSMECHHWNTYLFSCNSAWKFDFQVGHNHRTPIPLGLTEVEIK